MSKIDAYEHEVLAAFDNGQLKSVATKAELAKFRAAARATVNKALEEGVPYQTLIAKRRASAAGT